MRAQAQHRHRGLGDHRQVDGDGVALADPQVQQGVRGLLHLLVQLGVRDVAGVAVRLADEVDRHLVAVAGLDVAVDAVVGDVELAVREPGGERRLAPVEDLGEVLAPRQPAAGLVGPERLVVLVGLRVEVLGAVRLGRELRLRGKRAVLVSEVLEGLLGRLVRHWASSCDGAGADAGTRVVGWEARTPHCQPTQRVCGWRGQVGGFTDRSGGRSVRRAAPNSWPWVTWSTAG